jgi:hypothetical protein
LVSLSGHCSVSGRTLSCLYRAVPVVSCIACVTSLPPVADAPSFHWCPCSPLPLHPPRVPSSVVLTLAGFAPAAVHRSSDQGASVRPATLPISRVLFVACLLLAYCLFACCSLVHHCFRLCPPIQVHSCGLWCTYPVTLFAARSPPTRHPAHLHLHSFINRCCGRMHCAALATDPTMGIVQRKKPGPVPGSKKPVPATKCVVPLLVLLMPLLTPDP